MRGIHRWPVSFPYKGQWRRALVFFLICAWINSWVKNHEADDLRCHRAHYDVTVIYPTKYVEIILSGTGGLFVHILNSLSHGECGFDFKCVISAAPTGDVPTTSEWLTLLLPTKVCLILEVWRYIHVYMRTFAIILGAFSPFRYFACFFRIIKTLPLTEYRVHIDRFFHPILSQNQNHERPR